MELWTARRRVFHRPGSRVFLASRATEWRLCPQHLYPALLIDPCSKYLPVSLPPADGCTAWLVVRDEGGGANFPPGGGGRRPSPPELWGRVLSFFFDCWKWKTAHETRKWEDNEPELEPDGTILYLCHLALLINLKKITPILRVIVCPSLKPKSSLGVESGAWACLLNSLSCFTHLYTKNKKLINNGHYIIP